MVWENSCWFFNQESLFWKVLHRNLNWIKCVKCWKSFNRKRKVFTKKNEILRFWYVRNRADFLNKNLLKFFSPISLSDLKYFILIFVGIWIAAGPLWVAAAGPHSCVHIHLGLGGSSQSNVSQFYPENLKLARCSKEVQPLTIFINIKSNQNLIKKLL